jgi:RNA polymerase sigma-70 factor (ECF subfamily)
LSSLLTASTDSSLVERVRRQEPAAWQAFVDLYGPLVYAWCRRQSLAASDAADVMQETLLAVSRAMPSFDPAGGRLRGWLWTITANKIRDHFRRLPADQAAGGSAMASRLRELPAQPPEDASTTGPGTGELRGLLDRALKVAEQEVEPQTWRAFVLVVLQGKATAEAAAELGLSANSVRQAKSRVLRRLRQLIEGFGSS